jgi:superfamily II RNA helicase
VNQVAAEVYARFKKTYKTGQSVWGIWTRDYRHAAMKCQILITVPEMLGLLLLSPMHVDWTKKIKRVIFDEVHCIGLMDGGLLRLLINL